MSLPLQSLWSTQTWLQRSLIETIQRLLVDLVSVGVVDDATQAANAANNGDQDSQDNAGPGGPEVPAVCLGLVQRQVDDRGQPEGGWASSKRPNESHQVCKTRLVIMMPSKVR